MICLIFQTQIEMINFCYASGFMITESFKPFALMRFFILHINLHRFQLFLRSYQKGRFSAAELKLSLC